MAGEHKQHRQRTRERLRRGGLDSFAAHEVLEYLLFHAVPQGDVNPLAHRLLDRFGSVDQVLRAEKEELMQVPGVGPHVAGFLTAIHGLTQVYFTEATQQRERINNLYDALPEDMKERELPTVPELNVYYFDGLGYYLGELGQRWREPFEPVRMLVDEAIARHAQSVVVVFRTGQAGYDIGEHTDTWRELGRVLHIFTKIELRVIDVLLQTVNGISSCRESGLLKDCAVEVSEQEEIMDNSWFWQ